VADRLTLDHDDLHFFSCHLWARLLVSQPRPSWLVALPSQDWGAVPFVSTPISVPELRNHWAGFLVALIYAMFLDRWMKVALRQVPRRSRVDNLRRSIISVRFWCSRCLLLLANDHERDQAGHHETLSCAPSVASSILARP